MLILSKCVLLCTRTRARKHTPMHAHMYTQKHTHTRTHTHIHTDMLLTVARDFMRNMAQPFDQVGLHIHVVHLHTTHRNAGVRMQSTEMYYKCQTEMC